MTRRMLRAAAASVQHLERQPKGESMRRLALTSLLLLLATTALMAPSAAQSSGNPIQQGTVRVKVGTPLFFLGPGPGCLFRVDFGLTSDAGQPVGFGRQCVQSQTPVPCPTFCDVVVGRLTLNLAGGKIEADWTISETFSPDFTTVTQVLAGTVTGGTGLYGDAAGTVSGGGVVIFNRDGTLTTDLEIVVTLT
jgi:hypothetical protein